MSQLSEKGLPDMYALRLSLIILLSAAYTSAFGISQAESAQLKKAIEKLEGKSFSLCEVGRSKTEWNDCFADVSYAYNPAHESDCKGWLIHCLARAETARRVGLFRNGSLYLGVTETSYGNIFLGKFKPDIRFELTHLASGFAFTNQSLRAGIFSLGDLSGLGWRLDKNASNAKPLVGLWDRGRFIQSSEANRLSFLAEFLPLVPMSLRSTGAFGILAAEAGLERDTQNATTTLHKLPGDNTNHPAEIVAGRERRGDATALAAREKERVAQEGGETQKAGQVRIEKERLAREDAERQKAAQALLEKERLANAEADRRLAALEQELRQLKDRLARESEESASLKKKLQKLEAETVDKLSVQPKRYGLVIGNAQYHVVGKLENSVTDAKAFSDSLAELGFAVSSFYNVSQRDLLTSIREFENKLRGGDEVVFYYAGHGVQLGNTNYLLPVDVGNSSASQVRDQAIPLQTILDRLSEKDVKFALAVIDACRDDPFKGTGRAIGSRGLAPTTAATGQMIIYAAGAGQQALDKLNDKDRNPNGVFTRVFLKEMKKPGVTINSILRTVRHEVFEIARSVGHEQVPAVYDQTIGEFYFRK